MGVLKYINKKEGGDGQGVYEQAIHLMGCEVKLSYKYINFVVPIYYPIETLPHFEPAIHFWHFELCLPSKFQTQPESGQDRSGLRLNQGSYTGKLKAYLYYLQFYFSLVSP